MKLFHIIFQNYTVFTPQIQIFELQIKPSKSIKYNLQMYFIY